MYILMVSRGVFSIPPRSSGGGAEKHAYELASALAQMGHSVDLIASSANPPMPLVPGMIVHRTRINGTSIPTDAPFYLWLLKHSLAVAGTVAVAARNIKRKSRGYDVVHVHGNASAFFFSKLVDISPLLYTVHDPPPSTVQYDRIDERLVREAVFRSIDLPALKAVDHVIAVNPSIKQTLTRLQVQSAKISVIPSGTRVHEILSLRARDKALGIFVGQLVRRKGVHFLIEAFSRVPELRLAVVGDGPERTYLRELARKLGCADRVTFYGYLTSSDLEECYSRASFGVFPSLADAMPLALLECMGHGIPPLVSRFPGAEWIIKHGENGLLHNPGDVEEIQEQLSLVRSDPGLCMRMGNRARRTVEHDFTWETVARKMVSTYEKVIQPC